MIVAWRLVDSRIPEADALSGEGAGISGGRWNHEGTPVVYASDSLALAALELFVHSEKRNIGLSLTAYQIEIPGDIAVARRDPSGLPPNWRSDPPSPHTMDFGTEWVARGTAAVLLVPSVIVPVERNLVLNPAHRDFRRIRVVRRDPFSFDPRMWK